MKKRILRSLIGLFLIFVVVGIAPSITSRVPGENRVELIFSQNQDDIEYLPIETTLEPILEQFLNSKTNEESNTVIEYNVRTGMEEEYIVDFDEIRSDVSKIEPFEGNYYRSLMEQSAEWMEYSDSLRSSAPLGVSDLKRVNDTTIFPWSAVVKIYVRTVTGQGYVGSGAMIDANHVLTAGHVVYSHSEGGWMDEIRIMPGKNGTGISLTQEPYGRAYASHIRSTAGWLEDSSSGHDWAVITLDRDIGDETGWLGVTTLPYTHNNYSDFVTTGGYPATTLGGWYMYNVSKAGGSADELSHNYGFYIEGGQSGSSAWTYQNSSPYVISIVAYGPGGSGGVGSGTRITTEKFNMINLWLEQDESVEPQPDFDVAGSNNILADINYINLVPILFTSIPITTVVQNHGNLGVNKVVLGYYLTEDANLTSDDHLIGKTTIRNMGPSETRTVSHSMRVPLSTPPGYYKLGWIIDPDNQVDEYFEDNNVFLHGLQLSVISTFIDQWLGNPLWLSLTIAGVVLAIGLPTLFGILRRRKRKVLAMG